MALPSTRPARRDPEMPAVGMLMLERHFTINEIAEQWNMPYSTVLELFRDEPGLVCKPKVRTAERRDPGRKKRGYKVIRVPESVMLRVYSAMVNR